ncbi:MAG: TrkA family potassium uptake protein [Chloroflexi bacterium]|nr:TrkA family potassium uptake protein [Chloroflexota bacterium]MDA8187858.1 TrkA family potassium uptake protein [Dehalococcoidales bacterium]
MRVIILGCGRVGSKLATTLDSEGHEVIIIDLNADQFRRLGSEFKGTAMVGTGIDEDVLLRAGIEQADAFVAVTNGDNTNIMSSEIARAIFNVPKVITRIYDPVRQETYRGLGLETICPTIIGAKAIKNVLEGKSAETSIL